MLKKTENIMDSVVTYMEKEFLIKRNWLRIDNENLSNILEIKGLNSIKELEKLYLHNNDLILKNKDFGYFSLDKYEYQSGEITKLDPVNISFLHQELRDKLIEFKKPKGLVTASGELQGDITCSLGNFYPNVKNTGNKMEFHHLLLNDLKKCSGFVENGYINYKIRQ